MKDLELKAIETEYVVQTNAAIKVGINDMRRRLMRDAALPAPAKPAVPAVNYERRHGRRRLFT